MRYLDNASTSFPKPHTVLEEISKYLLLYGVTPNRTSSPMAKEAEKIVEETRKKLAGLMGISDEKKVIFTMNATQSLNMVIRGMMEPGSTILHCTSSHNSVLRPLHHGKKTHSVDIRPFTVFQDGSYDEEILTANIKKRPKLLILNHASNVTGVYSDYTSIIQKAKEYNVPILLDVSQTLGHCRLSFGEEVDFIAGTGHKALYGPPGVGFLCVNTPEKLPAFLHGGSGGNVSLSPYHPNILPHKYEAGTLNTLSIAGLYGALQFLEESRETGKERLRFLMTYLTRTLSDLPGITLYGDVDLSKKTPVLSFTLKDILPNEIGYILQERFGISVRTGLHCAPLMHQVLGTYPTGTVRVALSLFTTKEDIDALSEALRAIIEENQYIRNRESENVING